MKELFSFDGGFMSFLNVVSDICIISVLWILCCIPLVTAGASTTAAYYTIVKVVRKQRGGLRQEFFKSFKLNFKDSLFINIIYLIIGLILAININLMYKSLDTATTNLNFNLLFIYIVLLLMIIGAMIYTYPALSRFSMRRMQLVRFSLFAMFRHFPSTIVLLTMFILSLVIMAVLPIGVIFMPGICLYVYTIIMERILRKYMSNEMIEQWDGEQFDEVM